MLSQHSQSYVVAPQVPEAVEELCETAPPAGQQPQGQADRQAEADAERGESEMPVVSLCCTLFVMFVFI